MSKKDGGPVFPFMPQANPGEWASGQAGISLRDWFAGMVLTGLVMAHDAKDDLNRGLFLEGYSEAAYDIADAMLAEREK